MHYLHEKAGVEYLCNMPWFPCPLSYLLAALDFFYTLLSIFQYAIHNRAIAILILSFKNSFTVLLKNIVLCC
jgi:hypothetical protein